MCEYKRRLSFLCETNTYTFNVYYDLLKHKSFFFLIAQNCVSSFTITQKFEKEGRGDSCEIAIKLANSFAFEKVSESF